MRAQRKEEQKTFFFLFDAIVSLFFSLRRPSFAMGFRHAPFCLVLALFFSYLSL